MQYQLRFQWMWLFFLFYLNQGRAFLLPNTETNRRRRGILGIAAGADSEWKTGNVYKDIEYLRNAIARDRAEADLRVFQTQELLDTFAANRRPLIQDIKNFVIFPCLLSSVMALSSLTKKPVLSCLWKCLRILSAFGFWTVEVAMPILLLMQKYRGRYSVGINYLPLNIRSSPLRDFIDSEGGSRKINSCQDFTLCLLEQWVSAVFGTCCFGLWNLAFSKHQNCNLWPFVRFFTRLGSISSLHLYPELLFKLRRQPCPWKRSEYTSRQISAIMLKCGIVGLLLDLHQIMLRTQVPVVLLCLFVGLASFLNPLKIFSRWNHHKKLGTGKLIGLQAVNLSSYVLVSFLFYRSSLSAIKPVVFPLLLPCLVPFLHILALKKQVGITYSDNIPLTNTGRKHDQGRPNHLSHKQWRYQIFWKKPKRLEEVISDVLKEALISSSSGEKLRRKFPLIDLNDVSLLKNILDWADFKRYQFPDERPWSKDAVMAELEEEHEKDYQEGQFRDPLGVAVQQTFDIGLGFSDGHMDPLPPNEQPSLERLQARVAKSAIYRVNEIYDEAINEDLDAIVDPLEREIRKAKIRENNDAEIKYLKTQLVDLIPRKCKSKLSKPMHVSMYGLKNLRSFIEQRMFPDPPYSEKRHKQSPTTSSGRSQSLIKPGEQPPQHWRVIEPNKQRKH